MYHKKRNEIKLSIYKSALLLVLIMLINVWVLQKAEATTLTLTVSPTPTGIWANQFMDVYVMESGDAKVLANATKTYEVTNTSAAPSNLTKSLPTTKKITLNLIGENFVHVQYVLENGTKMTSTSGPYLIDTNGVGTFEMKLANANGATITTWSKDALKLVIGTPVTPSVSGYQKQYRIEGYHNEWQAYREGMTINLEGQHRIFGRVVNGTGQVSEQKMVVAHIDQGKPELVSLKLVRNANGLYDVAVKATDALSGVKEAKLANGVLLTNRNDTFEIKGLTAKPTSVIITDHAGNQLGSVAFATEPSITFDAPYTQSLSVYPNDVVATLSNATQYILGNKVYACTSTPCKTTLTYNTTLTAVGVNGAKETRNTVNITNINQRNYILSLSGKRNAVNSSQIDYRWNLSMASTTLNCEEGGNYAAYSVAGNNYTLTNKTASMRCYLTGIYKGKTLTSAVLSIQADAIHSTGVPKSEVGTNIYVEETRMGKAYLINGKVHNYKNNELPIPQNEITRD